MCGLLLTLYTTGTNGMGQETKMAFIHRGKTAAKLRWVGLLSLT